jgi:hypothetical protein
MFITSSLLHRKNKKKHYGIGQHPRSKLQHQLDHMFGSGKDYTRFTNAKSCRFGQLIVCDHRAVKYFYDLRRIFGKKRWERARLLRIDYNPLLLLNIK